MRPASQHLAVRKRKKQGECKDGHRAPHPFPWKQKTGGYLLGQEGAWAQASLACVPSISDIVENQIWDSEAEEWFGTSPTDMSTDWHMFSTSGDVSLSQSCTIPYGMIFLKIVPSFLVCSGVSEHILLTSCPLDSGMIQLWFHCPLSMEAHKNPGSW